MGPRADPCGTPYSSDCGQEGMPLIVTDYIGTNLNWKTTYLQLPTRILNRVYVQKAIAGLYLGFSCTDNIASGGSGFVLLRIIISETVEVYSCFQHM